MKLPLKSITVENLEQARARIAELEKGLDEAIGIIVKRDALLESYERRIRTLEEKLETSPPQP